MPVPQIVLFTVCALDLCILSGDDSARSLCNSAHSGYDDDHQCIASSFHTPPSVSNEENKKLMRSYNFEERCCGRRLVRARVRWHFLCTQFNAHRHQLEHAFSVRTA